MSPNICLENEANHFGFEGFHIIFHAQIDVSVVALCSAHSCMYLLF